MPIDNILHMNILSLFIMIHAIIGISHCLIFKKEINNQDPSALCIDGTPNFYYLSNTSSSSPTNLLIYFMNTPKATFCGSDSLSSSL